MVIIVKKFLTWTILLINEILINPTIQVTKININKIRWIVQRIDGSIRSTYSVKREPASTRAQISATILKKCCAVVYFLINLLKHKL